jgi:hypothetical protein
MSVEDPKGNSLFQQSGDKYITLRMAVKGKVVRMDMQLQSMGSASQQHYRLTGNRSRMETPRDAVGIRGRDQRITQNAAGCANDSISPIQCQSYEFLCALCVLCGES